MTNRLSDSVLSVSLWLILLRTCFDTSSAAGVVLSYPQHRHRSQEL
jgi:hypothetical protein